MKFEYVPKTPGHKFTLWFGKTGQFTFYFGTNTHKRGKFYFFK